MDNNRIVGALLGLALGDAYGAPFEGGPIERALWFIIGKNKGRFRYTDDTQMTIDVVESIIATQTINQQDLAQRFASSYRWSRGYGPSAGKILKQIKAGKSWDEANKAIYPEGAFGNGGAMRSSAVGLFYANKSEDELIEAVRDVAVITHSHPLAIEGAILQALAVGLAYKRFTPEIILERLSLCAKTKEFKQRIDIAKYLYQMTDEPSADTVAAKLGNGMTAIDSCATAIYIALRHQQHCFEELLDFTIKVKGDVDTIAAMAGAIWGAGHGDQQLPKARLAQLENYEYLDKLCRQFSQLIVI